METRQQLPIGTFYTPNSKINGLWALQRPLTVKWGNGAQIFKKISEIWGYPDIVFGKQDNIDGSLSVDYDITTEPTIVADWSNLPFNDNQFNFGYWDPPYKGYIGKDGSVHYFRMESCVREITRVCSQRVAILSPLIYPCPKGWTREAIIAITYGPNKIIRSLQTFTKDI